MEKIKLQTEIIKIKLTFFTGLAGGVAYLLLKLYNLKVDITILYVLLIPILLYSDVGVLLNIGYINNKYKELELWK